MKLLRPSSSVCYRLKLPTLNNNESINNVELSEVERRSLTLEYRTGAAVQLTRSSIFVHGGLVIPLNLNEITTQRIQEELMLFFAKQMTGNTNNGKSSIDSSISDSSIFKNLDDWISPHVFALDLITRKWTLFQTINDHPTNNGPNPLKCVYHSICFHEDKMYKFGGLVVSPTNGYELVASNELWELDLVTRQWRLIPTNPNLMRRFNHSMMVHTDSHEVTRLIIIGGRNNLDQEITIVDYFNVNTGKWESLETIDTSNKITTNINGNPSHLTKSVNVPVLIENGINNYRHPNNNVPVGNNNNNNNNNNKVTGTDRSQSIDSKTSSSSSSVDSSTTNSGWASANNSNIPIIVYYNNETNIDTSNEIPSPIVALPLLPKSQGLRMNSFQDKDTLRIALNLKNPSAAFFKKGILVTGFYPTTKRSDFHCYIYDLSCAFWTKIAIDCPDSDINHHRFNELFVWKSHHRAILLGTEHDDHYSPSVQRFDFLLSFRLAMMNVMKEVPRYILDHDKGEMVPLIPEDEKSIPKSLRTSINSSQQNTSHTNTNTTTSQFEKYIKYVTTPLELESTSSIFPPYALVLGKDALEIFGKYISDFEFITSNGDSVAIPIYLLRKRWGRYFDMLLARAYSKVCQDHDQHFESQQQQQQQQISQPQPTVSTTNPSHPSDTQRKRSPISFNAASKKNGSFSSQHSDDRLSPSTSTTDLLSPRLSPVTKGKQPISTNATTIAATTTGATSTRNSPIPRSNNKSDIPIFRVPFQDSSMDPTMRRSPDVQTIDYGGFNPNNNPNVPDTVLNATTSEANKRRSSSVLGSLATIRNNGPNGSGRRASHPVAFSSNVINTPEKPVVNNPVFTRRRSSLRIFSATQTSRRPSILSQHTSRRPSILSQHTSRRASVFSQTSGASYISQTSDRRAHYPHSQLSRHSSIPTISDGYITPIQFELPNIPLPSPSEPPAMSLPPTPTGSISSNMSHHTSHQYPYHGNHHPYYPNALRSRKNSLEFYPSPRHSSLSTRRSSYESRLRSSRSSSLPDISPGAPHSQRRSSYLSARSSYLSPTTSIISHSAGSSPRGSVSSMAPSVMSNSMSHINERGGQHSIDQVDLEPLLTPRSLYMPWPTDTVKAFAEFFYTGKVNGKWTLAPTVLDLLVMSQLYEIPLLYDMITEILYTLVGKKEEMLKLTVRNMVNGFIDSMWKMYDKDGEKVEIALADNEIYQELIRLKQSLNNINDGFLDMHILEKSLKNKTNDLRSASEISGPNSEMSSKGSQYDILMDNKMKKKFSNLNIDDKDKDKDKENNPDIIFAGGPRDSHDSISSFVYHRHKSIANPWRKKSILSKEFIMDLDDAMDKQEEFLMGQHENITDLGEKLKDFKIRGKSVSNDDDGGANNETTTLSPTSSSSSSSSSSSEDENDVSEFNERNIGSISSRKIRKQLQMEVALDESIDPLFKSGNVNNGNSIVGSGNVNLLKNSLMNQRYQLQNVNNGTVTPPGHSPHSSRMNSGVGGVGIRSNMIPISPADMIDDKNSEEEITLDNLVSEENPAIADYVIKLIYRTAVMVNDSRLMIRCMDCLEFSSLLKRIKKNILKDYLKLNPLRRKTSVMMSQSPVVSPMSRQFPIPKRTNDIISANANTNNTKMGMNQSNTSNNMIESTESSILSPMIPQQISPRSSVTPVGLELSSSTSNIISPVPSKGKKCSNGSVLSASSPFQFFGKKRG